MPYTIVQDEPGCSECGTGATWMVARPDGLSLGMSYIDQYEATRFADMLNDAFDSGAAAARPNRRIGPEDRRRDTDELFTPEKRSYPTGRRRSDDDIPF